MMTKDQIRFAVGDCLTALGYLDKIKGLDIKWNVVRTAVLSLESIYLQLENEKS